MTNRETIYHDRYFDWMVCLVNDDYYTGGRSFDTLLYCLNQWDFTYILAMDENRALDGENLRYRFERETGDSIEDVLNGCYDGARCSVLEMMVALAIRCEEHIMINQDIGNRAGRWFWKMIENLGLIDMDDDHFNDEYLDFVIERLLNREYDADGNGGLFVIEHDRRRDMRKIDIWYQMMAYLTELLVGGYLDE